MQLTRDSQPASNRVTAIADDCITAGGREFGRSVILSAEKIVSDWPVTGVDSLEQASWAPVLELNPELVLLGTGTAHAFPDSAILAPLYARGIGIEIMTTDAACRTYNLLLAEDRRVAAALIVGVAL